MREELSEPEFKGAAMPRSPSDRHAGVHSRMQGWSAFAKSFIDTVFRSAEANAVAVALRSEPIPAVLDRTAEVIGDRDEAMRWLGTPVPALGYATPVTLMGTPEGVDLVRRVLGQMEWGSW